jgi:hypothetical protein
MKRAIITVVATLAVCWVAGPGCSRDSVGAERHKLVKEFLGCIPDSLGDQRREEIVGLFERLWYRDEQGQVFPHDIREITADLRRYVGAGTIEADTLLYFMAKVGYYTYRKDPRYNLPEGVVDHPTLNPDAALIRFDPDSIGRRLQMYYRVPKDSSKTKAPQAEPKKK